MKQLYERAGTTSTTDRIDATLRDAIGAHAGANRPGNVCEARSLRLYRNGLIARMTGSQYGCGAR